MMDFTELTAAWKSRNTHSFETKRIEGFLQHAVKERRNNFNLLLKYDYLISLILSIIFIIISFYFSFKYKWVAALSMLSFTGLLFLHYRCIERIESVKFRTGGLVQVMQQYVERFQRFRMMYEVAIPLFAGLLTAVFLRLYSSLEWAYLPVLCFSAMFISWIAVKLIWKVAYRRQWENAENLNRIIKRLTK